MGKNIIENMIFPLNGNVTHGQLGKLALADLGLHVHSGSLCRWPCLGASAGSAPQPLRAVELASSQRRPSAPVRCRRRARILSARKTSSSGSIIHFVTCLRSRVLRRHAMALVQGLVQGTPAIMCILQSSCSTSYSPRLVSGCRRTSRT